MKTIAVYVTITEEFLEVYEEIYMSIPCWTDLGIDDEFVSIMCRIEDAPYVEKMLAPFI